jgi:hypothetical protein
MYQHWSVQTYGRTRNEDACIPLKMSLGIIALGWDSEM